MENISQAIQVAAIVRKYIQSKKLISKAEQKELLEKQENVFRQLRSVSSLK